MSNGALLMVGLAFLMMELIVFVPFLAVKSDLIVLIYSFLSLIGSDSLTKFGVRCGWELVDFFEIRKSCNFPELLAVKFPSIVVSFSFSARSGKVLFKKFL